MLTPVAILLPLIPIGVLLSTKGLMFLLLSAYGGAMWTFLSGAPRVHTVMVPDLERARKFYEEHLKMSEAELPLQYYYGYEQGLMGSSFDAPYFPADLSGRRIDYTSPRSVTTAPPDTPGLWYQLSDNAQLHVIPGSPDNDRANSSVVSSMSSGLGSPYGSVGSVGSPYPRPSGSPTSRFRHTSYDRDTIKALLQYVIKQRITHSVRSEKPLTFWVRDAAGEIVEISQVQA
ncbi:MAG: hypothetical protein NW237_06295 [Cyanobacteriota bacterium]|nr:hypothetical protein [Cyanobacteriota bacterium]